MGTDDECNDDKAGDPEGDSFCGFQSVIGGVILGVGVCMIVAGLFFYGWFSTRQESEDRANSGFAEDVSTYTDVELVVVAAPQNDEPVGLSPIEQVPSMRRPRVLGVPSDPDDAARPGLKDGLSPLLKKDFVMRVGSHDTERPASVSVIDHVKRTAALLRSADSPAIMLPVVVRRDPLLDSRLYPYLGLDMDHKEHVILEVVIRRLTTSSNSTELGAGAEESLGSQRLGIAFHVSPMVVSYVAPWSPAQGKLQPGDHVVAIDDWRTDSALTAQSVLEALAKAPPSSEDPDHIHLLVARPMAGLRSDGGPEDGRPNAMAPDGEGSRETDTTMDIPEVVADIDNELEGDGRGPRSVFVLRKESSLL